MILDIYHVMQYLNQYNKIKAYLQSDFIT